MRLSAIILLLVVMLSLTVEAKTILYVSASNAADCSHLSDLDKLFCTQLEGLGYNVKPIWEKNVKDNSSTWQTESSSADLIFLGSVSNEMANLSAYQPIFCGNISAAGKPVFASFINSYINTTRFKGCGFDIPGISYSSNDENKCSGLEEGVFKVTRSGYITYGFPEYITLYTTSNPAMIFGAKDSNLGWTSTNCDPPGTPETGLYTIIDNKSGSVFWGLDRPDLFTPEAWKIFKRIILYTLDDWRWNFSVIVYPNVTNAAATVNEPLNIRTAITWQKGNISNESITINITGPVNQVINTTVSEISNKNITFTAVGSYNVTIEGEGGSIKFPVTVGDLTVNILSGGYTPNSNYTINASVYSQGSAYPDAVVKYRITNESYNEFASGTLTWNGANYGGVISTGAWDQNIIISVIAENTTTGKSGATYKVVGLSSLSPYTTLTTNKNIYKPGETVIFNLTSLATISGANITNLTSPSGTNLLTTAAMNCYGTYCTYTWTTGQGSANGTYSVEAQALIGGTIVKKEKTFDILAWNFKAYADKLQYKQGDNITLSIEIFDAYTQMLAITANISISSLYNGVLNFQGEEVKNVTIPVNSSWTPGAYVALIALNDSDGRLINKNISFFVIGKGIIDVTPPSWNISTTSPGIYNKTFIVKNTGNSIATNISVSILGTNILTLDTSSMADNLPPGNTTNFTVFANITSEGDWNGTISLTTSVENIEIPFSAYYYRNVSLSFLSLTPSSSLRLYTIPGKQTQKTVELKNTGDIEAANLSYEISGLTGLSISGIAEAIAPGDSNTITVVLDGTGMAVGQESGSIRFSSSAGNATLSVTAIILDDLKSKAEDMLTEIDLFLENVSKIPDKSKISEIKGLVDEAKSNLQKTIEKWESGDYEGASIAFEKAHNKLSESQNAYVNALSASAAAAKQSAGFIWIFALVVILIIIAVTAYKYRSHIKQIINNIVAKLQKKEQLQKKESKPPPEPKEKEPEFKEPGQYRTEYY